MGAIMAMEMSQIKWQTNPWVDNALLTEITEGEHDNTDLVQHVCQVVRQVEDVVIHSVKKVTEELAQRVMDQPTVTMKRLVLNAELTYSFNSTPVHLTDEDPN